MNPLFYNLYQLGNNRKNGYLEDFITEILCSCLNSNISFARHFCEQLLEFFEYDPSFKFETQYFISALDNHHSGSKPDLIYISTEAIIFIESKIASKEGEKQLLRYSEHLNSDNSSKRKILVYLTRDYDPRPTPENIEFIQIRWHQVANLSTNYIDDNLIKEFYKCLKKLKLTMNNKFSPADIIALSNFNNAKKIMDETMRGEVERKFKEVTGSTSNSVSMVQIRDHDRYIYLAKNTNGLQIGLGYWFNSDEIEEYPQYGIVVQINPLEDKNDQLQKDIKKVYSVLDQVKWTPINLEDSNKWSALFRRESMNQVLSREDHIEYITEYFKTALEEIRKFIKEKELAINRSFFSQNYDTVSNHATNI